MWPGEKQGSWASAEGALGCWGGGGRSGSLSPSCYKQGPPVCRLFQWGTEMNSMGGHGAPSQASACTTPPQSWGGPAICALCLRRGIASPFLFYTPLHTHMHNYKKHSSQEPGRIKDFPQGGGDPIALIYLFSSPSLSIKKERKNEWIYIEATISFLLQLALFGSVPSSRSLSMKYQLFPLLSSPQSLPSHWHTMRGCVFLGVADWLAEIVLIAHCLCPDFFGGKKDQTPP